MSDVFWQSGETANQTSQGNTSSGFWGDEPSQQSQQGFFRDEEPSNQELDSIWADESEESNSVVEQIDEIIETLQDSLDHKDLALANALVSLIELYQS